VSRRHLQTLEMRRLELVERSGAQRVAMRTNLAPLLEKVATLDRVIASVRRYPVLVAAVAAGVALLGSRKLFGWIARGLTLYTLLRRI
jgi:type II secretory pathway component PulF